MLEKAGVLPERLGSVEMRLTQGPFAEYLGTVDRLDDSGRVCVLLDMLGRTISITVPANPPNRPSASSSSCTNQCHKASPDRDST
jgi:hypothetical protein